jgi:hypothetical protein
MTMRVGIQLFALKHYWSISTGSCLTTLLIALMLLQVTTPVYLPEELVDITALEQ